MSIASSADFAHERLVSARNGLIQRGGTAILVRLEQPTHFQRATATLLRRYPLPALIVCSTAARAYAVRVALARFAPRHTHITIAPRAAAAIADVVVTCDPWNRAANTVIGPDATSATYPNMLAALHIFKHAIAAGQQIVAFVAAAPWHPALDTLCLKRYRFTPRDDLPMDEEYRTRGIPHPASFARYGSSEDRYDEESWP
jgi:hypothetical protein